MLLPVTKVQSTGVDKNQRVAQRCGKYPERKCRVAMKPKGEAPNSALGDHGGSCEELMSKLILKDEWKLVTRKNQRQEVKRRTGEQLRVGRILGKRKEYVQGLGGWGCGVRQRKNGKDPVCLEHRVKRKAGVGSKARFCKASQWAVQWEASKGSEKGN